MFGIEPESTKWMHSGAIFKPSARQPDILHWKQKLQTEWIQIDTTDWRQDSLKLFKFEQCLEYCIAVCIMKVRTWNFTVCYTHFSVNKIWIPYGWSSAMQKNPECLINTLLYGDLCNSQKLLAYLSMHEYLQVVNCYLHLAGCHLEISHNDDGFDRSWKVRNTWIHCSTRSKMGFSFTQSLYFNLLNSVFTLQQHSLSRSLNTFFTLST